MDAPQLPFADGPSRDDLVALLLAQVARLERGGLPKQPRLTEPDLRHWNHFRRRLTMVDFVTLLFEDSAQAFPVPFDLGEWETGPLDGLTDDAAAALVREAAAEDGRETLDFLQAAARRLGRPSGGRIADLPRVQPTERVLEVAGTSGRGAVWMCRTYDDLAFDRNFVFVVADDADRLLVGLAAAELRASAPVVWTADELRQELAAGARFDRIIAAEGYAPARALVDLAGGQGGTAWV